VPLLVRMKRLRSTLPRRLRTRKGTQHDVETNDEAERQVLR